jgi:hypothetical protein
VHRKILVKARSAAIISLLALAALDQKASDFAVHHAAALTVTGREAPVLQNIFIVKVSQGS